MLESLADRCHPRFGVPLVHPGSHHEKLVATPADDVVPGTELLDDEIGEPLQRGVPDSVAKEVVDLFEVVDIDEDERSRKGW